MMEEDWFRSANLEWLVEQLLCSRLASDRKFRLYACACCRRAEHLIDHAGIQELLVVVEDFADWLLGKETFKERVSQLRKGIGGITVSDAASNPAGAAREAVIRAAGFVVSYSREYYEVLDDVPYPSWAAAYARYAVAGTDNKQEQEQEREQLRLLRDIFGNPFRPVAFDPAWRTSTAVAIAQGMYDSRDFNAMPILADALQDSGCDNDDILNHCRDEKQVHVRGCWVVDLVLGKA